MAQLEPTITERRRVTRNSIYQLLFHAREPVSKQQISRELGLSMPTIHQNIGELMKAGLVRAGHMLRSTGGRPPVAYEIDPDFRFSIGAAITANHLRILACNLRQEELAYKSNRVEGRDAEAIEGDHLKREIDTFLREYHLDRSKLLGVGVTIPGIFDEKIDQVVLSPTLKMKNISLRQFLREEEYPVTVSNDSTSAGVAEIALNDGSVPRNFVYLLLENGIGGAIVIDGKVYEGVNGRSAEFGHMRIVPDGRRCNCGQKGCLEAYCSAFRFTRDLGITTDEFFSGLRNGNAEYQAVWEDILMHLSMGIVNLRMNFDCDIILGGFVTEYMKPYLPELRGKVALLDPFSEEADYVRISTVPHAAMRGAAWKFTEDFIKSI